MIKVSVFYPNNSGVSFDVDYYCNKHMPMVLDALGDACKRVAVETGICGADGVSPPLYVCMGHLYFDSVADFQDAFSPVAEKIMGDLKNYSNVTPEIQISTVNI